MEFLVRQRSPENDTWWTNMLAIEDAPIIVRELLRERQVVATHEEIEEALRWARSVDGWSDEHPPLIGLDGLV